MGDAFTVCERPRAVVAAKKASIAESEREALIASTKRRRADDGETEKGKAVKKRKRSITQKDDEIKQAEEALKQAKAAREKELQLLKTEQQTWVSEQQTFATDDTTKSEVVRTEKAEMELLVESLKTLEEAAAADDAAGKKTATIVAEKAQETIKHDKAMGSMQLLIDQATSQEQAARTASDKAASAFGALQVAPYFPQ